MLNRYTIAATVIVYAAFMIVAASHTINRYTVAFGVAAFAWITYQICLIAIARVRAFNAGLAEIAEIEERRARLAERRRLAMQALVAEQQALVAERQAPASLHVIRGSGLNGGSGRRR